MSEVGLVGRIDALAHALTAMLAGGYSMADGQSSRSNLPLGSAI
ncbi:MAG: hypothetical protein Q4C09_01475 [Atopobiaceae bacterium]|nr:hypothetical protein [Atopobiaceae bacterium]